MNAAAKAVMKELPDLVLAYGQSDEFRYVVGLLGVQVYGP
jgi:tRNA(His) 5'-end guanylyltransferase